MKYSLTIQHVDTCLSGFVNDHCNGDDELLVGVPVDGSTTIAVIKEGIMSELHSGLDEKLPEEIYDDQIKSVVLAMIGDAPDAKLFDASLDTPNDDEDGYSETCYAWFRLDWESEGDDDEAE